MRRRSFAKLTGFGGLLAGLLTGGLVLESRRGSSGHDAHEGGRRAAELGAGHDAYGSEADPPRAIGPGALVAVEDPGPIRPLDPNPREIEIHVLEQSIEIAEGKFFDAWTYNGTAPGPTIRATEGQVLHVTLFNDTDHPHSLHFHGSHDVDEDGWQAVFPRSSRKYVITAGPAGLHPYHCHTMPLARHFSRGMYGVLIVDPSPARAPAREIVLSLCGWDLDGDGRNELYAWNGIAGYYGRFPIKVRAGELVRLYVTNLVEYDVLGSFHLHAQTFDVFRSGTSQIPSEHTDVIHLGQAERAILEFRLPRRGRYMFHPHQIYMAERGAMGWLTAI